jgi:hypothetical protein
MFSQTIIRAVLVAAFAAAPAAANARLIDPYVDTGGLDPAIARAVVDRGSVDAASIPLDPAIARALGNRSTVHPASIPLDPAIARAIRSRSTVDAAHPARPCNPYCTREASGQDGAPGFRLHLTRLPLVR